MLHGCHIVHSTLLVFRVIKRHMKTADRHLIAKFSLPIPANHNHNNVKPLPVPVSFV